MDYDFSAEQIRQIPEIINTKSGGGYERFIDFTADIKNIPASNLYKQFGNNTYRSDTAEITYDKYDIEHYSVFNTEKGSIYTVPINTSVGLLNRLSEHGIVPKDEMTQVILNTDNNNWNKLIIPDRYGNKTNSIDLSDILTKEELSTVRTVMDQVEYLTENKEKQLQKIEEENSVITEFHNKTKESFHLIGDRTEFDIELEVEEQLRQIMAENEIAGEIKGVVLYGSRSRGIEESEQADIDIVVQINNSELEEDALFNLFSDMDIKIDGIPVDVNPIRPEETGTLDEYLPRAEAYLAQKQAERVAQIFSSVGEQTEVELEVPDDSTEQEKSLPTKEKTFAEQVDDVLSGKADRYNDLKVCNTPQILLDVGCRQLPMFYTQQHLRNAVKPKDRKKHTHGLDVDVIKSTPSLIAEPVMIIDSFTRNDSLLMVLSETDIDNCPIIVSVKPNGQGTYELETQDSNFITSIYGREDFGSFIERCAENDKLLFISKEKSQNLFSVLGLEFSKGLNSLDFDTIIHQSRNIVNTENGKRTDQNETTHSEQAKDKQSKNPDQTDKKSISVPEESPQLSFDVDSTIPIENKPVERNRNRNQA